MVTYYVTAVKYKNQEIDIDTHHELDYRPYFIVTM